MVESRKLSLDSRKLRYKLKVAFYLMSILPLLVCGYLVSNYILPHAGYKPDVLVSLAVSVVIASAGFYVVREIIERIVALAAEVKLFVSGDLSREFDAGKDDEIGELGEALNQLTMRIKSDIDELKNYKQITAQIDMDIQKRLLSLSTLLEINSMIAQGERLEDILAYSVEKSRALANSEAAYLFFRKEFAENFELKIADGTGVDALRKVKISVEDAVFAPAISGGGAVIVDSQNQLPPELKKGFQERLRLKNTLALPVVSTGRVAGILGIGNNHEPFAYRKEDIQLLEIFAKQMAIAVENQTLMHKVKNLEVKDSLTGLYNQSFITQRLEEEIRRAIAYQRPCSFVLLNLDDFRHLKTFCGPAYAENALKKIGALVKGAVSEVDRVARFSEDEFAIVLPEKNKRQAQGIAEEIRKKIEAAFKQEDDAAKRITVSGGVSENPLDGVDASELISKARSLLEIAKSQGKNRVLN